MVLVTSNKSKRLICTSYFGKVLREELQNSLEDLKSQLAELSPGCRALVNLSQMESMALDCATELGQAMDLIDQSQVTEVVRVIPDAEKDIGFNILSAFHYKNITQISSFTSMVEALKHLGM